LTDTPSVDTPVIDNLSRPEGPGITLPKPVNGTATPETTGTTPDPQTPANPAATPDPAQGQPDPNNLAPTAQPKVDEVPSTTGDDGVVLYDETGDAGLDLALAFIGKLGIAGNDPAMVAAANGDFTFLEAKLSTLGDEARGWEKHVQLGKDAFQRQLDAFNAEQTKTLNAAHALAGGKANWDNIVAWAGGQATPDEKATLNAMFEAGGMQANLAAKSIIDAYKSATGTTINPASPTREASSEAPKAPTSLTQRDYHKEVDALYRQLGNRMDGSPEYAALRQKYFGR
jgi:hypothetical protein